MRRWERSDRYNGNAYQCYSSVETGSYESRKKKGLSLDGICQSPMIPEWRLQMMANLIFRKYPSEKDKVSVLVNFILETHIGDVEETQKNDALVEAKRVEPEPKIQKLQEENKQLSAESKPEEVVDYREKITVLQYALEQYTNKDEGQDVPESVIEAFVTKIVVSQDGFDWYQRFDGDPDDPLHCKIEGKR